MSAKSSKNNGDYKTRAKKLKKLGLLPKDIDLRHALTPQLKAFITRRYNTNSDLIKNPEFYKAITVSRKTARKLHRASFVAVQKGSKVRLYIPSKPGETVRVIRGEIEKDDGFFKERLKAAGLDVINRAEKLIAGLGENEYVMVKIGAKAPFQQTFTDIATFMNYMDRWAPKNAGGKWTREKLISEMYLVKVSDRFYMEDGDTPELRATISRARRYHETPRRVYREEQAKKKKANRSN